jgi:hypothetical protein
VIVLIPLRHGKRWAWWSCWIALIAYIGYTITFAHYSSTTLAYSLVPDVAIPILLLVLAPRLLTKRTWACAATYPSPVAVFVDG